MAHVEAGAGASSLSKLDAGRPAVTVVLPVYEEALNLPRLLPRIGEALRKCDVPHEILVVDDASPDGSATVSRAVGHLHRLSLRVLERTGTRSLAGAIVDGAREARGPCVAVLDADLSHDPRSLPHLVERVLDGSADVAVGSRYVPGGRISSWPARRQAMSRLGTWLARRVTGVRDPLSGFFAARRELLDGSAVPLRPRGYKILLEVLGRASGLRIEEVPIEFRDRRLGKSKFGFREKREFLVQLAALLVARGTGGVARTSARGARVERVGGTVPGRGVARIPSGQRSENVERCGGAEA